MEPTDSWAHRAPPGIMAEFQTKYVAGLPGHLFTYNDGRLEVLDHKTQEAFSGYISKTGEFTLQLLPKRRRED